MEGCFPIFTDENLKNWGIQTQKKWSVLTNTVASRYLDFGYLELPLISKRKSDPCINIEI